MSGLLARVKLLQTSQKRSYRRLLVIVGALASLGILWGLVASNLNGLVSAAERLRPRYLVLAAAAAFASYVAIGMALREILILLGHRLRLGEVLGIAFVSTTANYFVSTAGVSGFALKAHLLRQRDVPYGVTVTASVVSTALIYFVLGVIIAQGVGYLALRMRGTMIPVMEGILGLLILAATAAPLIAFFVSRELRGRLTRTLFHWTNRVVYWVSKKEIPREDFTRFETQLNAGLEAIRGEKARLGKAVLFTCMDWGLTMLTLYFGFRAVGCELSAGYLSTGFAVGQATTLIPILPGGMGAMEGSMAAVYGRLGVPFEDALVAALIYRFAYYLLPGLASVFLFWGLKMSEPKLIEDTIEETLPEELQLIAEQLERRRERGGILRRLRGPAAGGSGEAA